MIIQTIEQVDVRHIYFQTISLFYVNLTLNIVYELNAVPLLFSIQLVYGIQGISIEINIAFEMFMYEFPINYIYKLTHKYNTHSFNVVVQLYGTNSRLSEELSYTYLFFACIK